MCWEKNLRQSHSQVEKESWASFVTISTWRIVREYVFPNLKVLTSIEEFNKYFTDMRTPAWINMKFLNHSKLISFNYLYSTCTAAMCNQTFLLLLVVVKVKQ